MSAPTLTYTDAWNATVNQRRRDLGGGQQEYVNQMAVNKMWRVYDWRGTTAKLPPFWLEPGVQDYGGVPSAIPTVPTDLLGLREVYLVQPNGNSPNWGVLRVVHNLEQTEVQSTPNCIVYKPEISGFRLHPRPSGSCTSPNYLVMGTYKKQPPKILRADFNTAMPWEDNYFDVFCAAVVWAGLVGAGERDSALKQNMVFQQILAEATAEAAREHGEEYVHPAEGVMDSYGWRMY